MAHYAAVTSLKNAILRLYKSQHTSFVSPIREILESTYKVVLSLQNVLKRWDEDRSSSEKIRALHRQITEAVCKLEDMFESHASKHEYHLSQFESNEAGSFSVALLDDDTTSFIAKIAMKLKKAMLLVFRNKNQLIYGSDIRDLMNMRDEVCSFTRTIKKMEMEYLEELANPVAEDEDDEDEDEDDGDFGVKWVGLCDVYWRVFSQVKNEVLQLLIIPIVGMAGIGKTTLAKRFLLTSSQLKFECHAFVKMGQKYNLREISRDIVAQVNPGLDKTLLEADDEIIAECLWQSLDGKRFLIILDNVWDEGFMNLTRMLPNYGSQGRVLITTRLKHIASFTHTNTMQLLTEEQSWRLFQRKMFGRLLCPFQFEEAGKKIAKRCDGHPLLIVTVANLLSRVDKTPEYWEKVATEKKSSIFTEANDRISKIVYPSYNYLSRHSKACFLYMGAFPQDHEVRRSRLINLWMAEGFLEQNPSQTLEDFAGKCFRELINSNVVVETDRDYTSYKPKSCRLHTVYWHMCTREAQNVKFMHVSNSYADGLAEAIQGQRRLSIYNNVLFGIKDVHSSMTSVSTACSLLCTGPYHQYQVPICLNLRLLRILDALTIRFYDFPDEVLYLVRLRYLSLTYNGELPPSISELQALEYFTIHQHLSIRCNVGESYLPVEIWHLQELKFLESVGRNLTDPCGAVLPNLRTLLDVGAPSYTSAVLEGLPNLNKLRVRIELDHDFFQPLSVFDHVHNLRDLQSLQFLVVNPEMGNEFTIPNSPTSISTCHLNKLTLSGFGFPWEDIREIAGLPSLQVLKLLCYAFQGEKWDAEDMVFVKLQYLLLEDSDLVQWTAKKTSFPHLSHLTIKDCSYERSLSYQSEKRLGLLTAIL